MEWSFWMFLGVELFGLVAGFVLGYLDGRFDGWRAAMRRVDEDARTLYAPKSKAKAYPKWICDDCAEKAGGWAEPEDICTYHKDLCGVCGELKAVTEPRDWHL